MLNVQLLNEYAKLPTIAHPGEDLGYDLYASEEVVLYPNRVTKVHTGIALEFNVDVEDICNDPYGAIIRDRSSMAARGITVSAGVIDAGYRGEIVVLLTLTGDQAAYIIQKGDKIAQIIPVPVYSHFPVRQVDNLTPSKRGENGFGSSGQR